jgi:curved DNA-binding protein CbpA
MRRASYSYGESSSRSDCQGDQKDYYKILGLLRNASDDEIKKAYRRLALLNHPDKNPNDSSSAARFQEIREAYETLSDEQKRLKYDSGGEKKTPLSNTERHSKDDDRGPSYDNRRPYDDDDFRVVRPSVAKCAVCGRRGCQYPHRNYTREGAVPFTFAEMEGWDSFGNVSRTTVEAEGHFGPLPMRSSSTREILSVDSPEQPQGRRSPYSIDEYDDFHSSCRDDGEYRERRTSYVYGENRPRNDGYRELGTSYGHKEYSPQGSDGYRGRGTTYVQGDNFSQGGDYRGRGTTYTSSPCSFNYFSPRESFPEALDDSSGPKLSKFFIRMRSRRGYEVSDRYSTSSHRDPDYYDERGERYNRGSDRDGHGGDWHYRGGPSGRYRY